MREGVSRDFNFLHQGSQGQKHLQRGANDHGRSFNYQSHSELTLQEIGTVSFRDNYTFNFNSRDSVVVKIFTYSDVTDTSTETKGNTLKQMHVYPRELAHVLILRILYNSTVFTHV